LAQRIVDAFGEDTLEIVATDAKRLATVKGLTLIKAKAVQAEFKRMYGVRETMVYLAGLGLSTSAAVALYKVYGPDTNTVVGHNPYVMCGFPAYVEFSVADRIAADLCMEYDSRERVHAGVLFVLQHNLQNGHTCLPQNKLLLTVAEFLHVEPENISVVLDEMLEAGDVYAAEFHEKAFVFLPEYLRAEQTVAAHLRALMAIPSVTAQDADRLINRLELTNNITYAPLQRKAISDALNNRALVLTGGPGTGKTTTVNGILAAFEQQGDRVALTAPTGRAAKRLSELTGRKATTIHRLLEVDYSQDNLVRFIHNEKNLLRCDVVVIDEMSMVDVLLFESLLCALKPACKIIMVGDEDQLPSVGAGNVLGGVMASQVVPTVRLTEIFRQAAQSAIVSNAHRIVAGEPLLLGGRDSDFFIMERDDPEICARLVCELVSRRLPKSYGLDPLEDIQVLCPTKIGPVGTVALNVMLQDCLNPAAMHKPQLNLRDRVLRLGDKVMQMKNNYDIPYTRPGGEDGAGAFNGDMGIIIDVDARAGSVTVRSEDRCIVYSSEYVRELEPAYAVTIHKSQGSEFAAIVIPVLDVPPKLCYRNLLYTGVTRARRLCVLTGHAREAAQMVSNARQNKRFSCLSDFLREDKL
ncbi:MAG: AAA family ATPase, partial [Ruthenibacterium sp.]